jgi:hypothetical protein
MVLTTVFAAVFLGLHGIPRSKSQKKVQAPAIPRTALPAEVSEATLSDIRSMLEKREYEISYDEQKKLLQSPNRKHNLRAYYEPGKFTVQTRVDTTGHQFKLELKNEGIFADGKLLYTASAKAKADHKNNHVEIDHHVFTEEFINNEEGVRQNFIIREAPKGTRQLQVKMTANGLKVKQGQGNELRFYTEANGTTQDELVYSDLKCWDANKQSLNATLAYVDNRIQISVDVANAAYPVTIDPIVANGNPQNPNKVIEINQSNMWLGFSVASAGDVNGDGYSDIIIGAPQYDKGQTNEGAAFIYPGTSGGISANAVTLECNQVDAQMGYSVATAGDFNGDGYSDVLVGIPFYDINGSDDGMVKLYYGSPQGILDNSVPKNFSTSDPGDNYGVSVATAGDIDADGYSDIIIGAHQNDIFQNNAGVVIVIYGAQTTYKKVEQLGVTQADAMFGFSVASAGDINGDGYSDVIVGARLYDKDANQQNEGAAFIYKGGAGGLDINPTVLPGDQLNGRMGHKVSSAGDVNGDGYSDILVSAFMYDNEHVNEGRIYLHLGSATGIDMVPKKIFEGNQTDARMGTSIACAGDVNGDGYADIMLGAQNFDNGQPNEGAVFIYHGSANGIGNTPASLLESNQAEGWFGTAVASAGDVNGDGYSDILVGCYTFDNGQNDEGHAFVYHGGAEGIGANQWAMVTNAHAAAQMGFSVASAGDLNADGYGDIVVGAPFYDSGQASEGVAFVYYGSVSGLNTASYHILEKNQTGSYFGGAVAGAGDVNGDGFDDVLVGAKEYTDGLLNEGAVFVYQGSSTGVKPGDIPQSLQLDMAGADFGNSVAGVGDINHDGYADIAVGAPSYSNTGNIFVFYGSQQGLGNLLSIPGPQINSHFGEAVSAAGDVNGDGYADIIAGAWGATNVEQGEGAIYIFHGAPGAMSTNPVKTIESNQVDARFGISVSSAGDMNGDGYSDVIAGASRLDHGQADEGIAAIYYGTNTGISTTLPVPTLLESNVASAYFGYAVSGAGDVNGDGYSDVIVGAYKLSNGFSEEGKAYVFHGSPSGAKTANSFSIEGENLNARLGWSVSNAGDVNGDGYSDVLVGIPTHDNGQYQNAGATALYYGNNSKGLRNNVRLYNSDNVTPINHAQFNVVTFGTGLFAKSFLGVNQGKLVVETKGAGISFSKQGTNPITNSTEYSAIFPTFTSLLTTGTELKWVKSKTGASTRVRVRVRYSPVLAITGQMYGPWRYVQPQLTGINNAPVPEEAMAETIKRKALPMEGENDKLSVVTYPNPVSDRLFIKTENPDQIRSVRLLSTGGKLVYQSQSSATEVDVRNLNAGMYVLLVTCQDGTQSSHKVIVKK